MIPFRCSYCGNLYCSSHRIPESHECVGLEFAKSPREVEYKEVSKEVERRREVEMPIITRVVRKTPFKERELFHIGLGLLLVFLVGFSFRLSLILGLIMAISFVAHELAHKFTAQRYGLKAGFRIDPFGAFITGISAIPFFPIKFIAPGAVMIGGFAYTNTIGKIALSGPLTNIVISLIAFTLSRFLHTWFLVTAAWLNALMALFNMIPFGVLDGFKVFSWSVKKWAFFFSISLVMFLISSPGLLRFL